MKALIQLEGTKIAPSPYALTITEFKVLNAEELSAVFFYADHRSPYSTYDQETRWENVSNTLKVKLNPKITAAIKKYEELSETSAVKLLKAARESVVKLEKYFKTVDLTLTDDNNKPIYHAKDLIANLSNMGKVISGLDELEELVQKQQQKDNPNRGGVVVNKYSQ
jgi:hypothetical protein